MTNRVLEVARPANLSKKVGGLTRDGDPKIAFHGSAEPLVRAQEPSP